MTPYQIWQIEEIKSSNVCWTPVTMSHSRMPDPSRNLNLKHIVHCHKKGNFCYIFITLLSRSIWLLSTNVSPQSISNCICIILVDLNKVKIYVLDVFRHQLLNFYWNLWKRFLNLLNCLEELVDIRFNWTKERMSVINPLECVK